MVAVDSDDTGASRGIGAGMAVHFASRGLRLGLCGRNRPESPTGADAMVAALDVADAGAMDSFADQVVNRFGRIDLWINNAGVLDPIGPPADADPTALERHQFGARRASGSTSWPSFSVIAALETVGPMFDEFRE